MCVCVCVRASETTGDRSTDDELTHVSTDTLTVPDEDKDTENMSVTDEEGHDPSPLLCLCTHVVYLYL